MHLIVTSWGRLPCHWGVGEVNSSESPDKFSSSLVIRNSESVSYNCDAQHPILCLLSERLFMWLTTRSSSINNSVKGPSPPNAGIVTGSHGRFWASREANSWFRWLKAFWIRFVFQLPRAWWNFTDIMLKGKVIMNTAYVLTEALFLFWWHRG